jgi:hypothetical protein
MNVSRSNFERHEPCPECGSRNNLGVWSDGHKFCFGCGYYVPASGDVHQVKQRLSAPSNGLVPYLPDDVSVHIPEVPYRWLKLCLTDEEILKHRVGWSNEKESVVFPVFGKDGELLMWQSRYFGANKKYPKYLTKGYKGDILHILGEHPTNRVVLVEDLVSAIVVSRLENSMPLWGSTIHLKTLRQLARYYGHLAIWLDSDKLATALKTSGQARLIFESVEVLNSEKDPKYQTEEQLRKILGKPLDKRDQPRYNLT